MNKVFDDLLLKYQKSQVTYNQSIIKVLRSYYEQRNIASLNPFNVLLLSDINLEENEITDTLDFLYKSGVRSFLVCDQSTALLRGLSLVLGNTSYSIFISQSYSWESTYGKRYGLLVELKKVRNDKVVK